MGKVIDLSQGSAVNSIGFKNVALNYAALSLITGTAIGELSYVQNSQGTAWLPGTIGGTYYPSGIYIWDGANWVSDRNAIAEQLQINVDDITQLQSDVAGKLDSVVAGSNITVDNTDPLQPVISSNGFDNGWARYKDTQRIDIGTALVINEGTGFQPILNNKGSVIETYKPSDVTTYYDGTKLTPRTVGDYHNFSIRFKARSSKINGKIDVGVDIGGSQGIIFNRTLTFAKGANVEQQFGMTFGGFSLSTFVANGGIVKLNAVEGNTSIYDIEFQVCQIYRA